DDSAGWPSIYLTKGWHKIVVEYREATGDAKAFLSWDAVSWGTISSTYFYYPSTYITTDLGAGENIVFNVRYALGTITEGLKGEYFNNENLYGTPVLTRIDPTISFNWEAGSPAPGIVNTDNFSVRWTGMIYAPSDKTYWFSNRAYYPDNGPITNDGMRLTINDNTIFDEYWNDGDDSAGWPSINLTKGWHKIVVEYREATGDARAFLSWNAVSWGAIEPGKFLSVIIPEGASAKGVVVYDLIPQEITSFSFSPPASSTVGSLFIWNIGTFTGFGEIRLSATISSTVIGSTSFTNYASITTTSNETNYDNNFASYNMHVVGPGIYVHKTMEKDPTWGEMQGEYISNIRPGQDKEINRPYFVDIDADGDFDFYLVGKDDNVYFFENQGTIHSPDFVNKGFVIDENGGVIIVGSHWISPSLCDIDGDSDYDLFIGESHGEITYYKNIGGVKEPKFKKIGFIKDKITNREIVKPYSMPFFVDIDGDSDYDLFIGTEDDGICWYENTGDSSSPEWGNKGELKDKNDDNIGSGRSRVSPYFVDIEGDLDYDLFFGDSQGFVWFYRNVGTPSSFSFEYATNDYNNIYDAGRTFTAPSFADIDGDSDYDMFIGWGNAIDLYKNEMTRSLDVSPGESVTYYIRYGNYGPFTANDVFVGDYLPNDIVNVSTNPIPSGSLTLDNITFYYWNLENLPINKEKTIVIKGSISEKALGSASLTNIATITSVNGFRHLENITSSWTTHIPTPELYVYKFQKKEPAFILGTITYAGINTEQGCVPKFVDIDCDGDYDMIVDGYEGPPYSGRDMQFLRNDGDPGNPSWTLITNDYASYSGGVIIEEEYRDSHCFVDIDNDGDFDLFQGDGLDEYIEYYRNDGDWKEPKWTLVNDEYIEVNGEEGELAPVFCDIDNDGDFDLFIGRENGKVTFYKNQGTPEEPNFIHVSDDYANIDVSKNSSLCFGDIDNDLDYDILVGNGNNGTITFVENIGSPGSPSWASPIELLSISNIPGINQPFNLHPELIDIDADGDLDLFIGYNGGNIAFFKNVTEKISAAAPGGTITYYIKYGNNGPGNISFVVKDTLPENVTFISASPNPSTITENILEWDVFIETKKWGIITIDCIPDPGLPDSSTLNNKVELFYPGCDGYLGNNSSIWLNHIISMDLSIEKKIREHPWTWITDQYGFIDVGDYSAPWFHDLDGDGDLDLIVGNGAGNVLFYKNEDETYSFEGSLTTGYLRAHPTVLDIEGDGDVEILVGYHLGKIRVYGGFGFNWSENGNFQTGGKDVDVGSFYATPCAVDIDGDGDLDLVVGREGGYLLKYYENAGGGNWIKKPDIYLDKIYYEIVPSFYDIDRDGDLDMFIGNRDGIINLHKNLGSLQSPGFSKFPSEANYIGINVGRNASPAFVDIDGDGNPDLFIGRKDGYITYFRNEGSYGTYTSKDSKIAYTLNCKKTGSLPANDVCVYDVLPLDNIEYLGWTIYPISYMPNFSTNTTNNNLILKWDFGDFGSNEESFIITIIGSVTGVASSTLVNYASITSSSSEKDYVNNYSSVTSHIVELVPDLVIEKYHGRCGWDEAMGQPSYVPPNGAYIHYYLYYENQGNLVANNVVIYDVLPPSVEYKDANPPPNTITGNILQWDIGNLHPGSGRKGPYIIKVWVPESVPVGSVLTNFASITTTTKELIEENNYATWTTIVSVPAIDLEIDKKGPRGTITPGSEVIYPIEFINNGTMTIYGVILVDYFDQYSLGGRNENRLRYIDIEGTPTISIIGSSSDVASVTLILGTMTPGFLYTIKLRFRISDDAIPGTYVFNYASITYTEDLATETYLCNNESITQDIVGLPSVNLRIAIAPMWGEGRSGEERKYSFLIYNEGTLESGGTITITFPKILEYIPTGTSRSEYSKEYEQGRTEPIVTRYLETWVLQWVIDPVEENKIRPSEHRLTIGGAGRRNIGTPYPDLAIDFPPGLPFFIVNTVVGTVTGTTTIHVTAEIKPWFVYDPTKTVEYSGSEETIVDTIIPFSTKRKISLLNQSSLDQQEKLSTMSIPKYIKERGYVFYVIRFENKDISSIALKDILSDDFDIMEESPVILVDATRALIGYFTKDENGEFRYDGEIPRNGEIWFWGRTKQKKIQVVNSPKIKFDDGKWQAMAIESYIDEIPPIVSSIDGFVETRTITLIWSVLDPPISANIPGSGIAKYILYSKEGDGTWTFREYRETQTTFVGKEGLKYSVYVLAVDNAGNSSDPSSIKIFQLVPATHTASRLGDVIVFPNPYIASKHKDYGISFGCRDEKYRKRNLTEYATIRIYNIAGELIKKIDIRPENGGVYIWKNPEKEVSSGVYIYLITNPEGQRCIGKLGIVK
ncbi:TPA: hypothetical protein DCX16_02705, partial [bacterium]|nr:hypothetical protein [bacterium]